MPGDRGLTGAPWEAEHLPARGYAETGMVSVLDRFSDVNPATATRPQPSVGCRVRGRVCRRGSIVEFSYRAVPAMTTYRLGYARVSTGEQDPDDPDRRADRRRRGPALRRPCLRSSNWNSATSFLVLSEERHWSHCRALSSRMNALTLTSSSAYAWQLAGSGLSIRRGWPLGMSCTAMVSAVTLPLLTSMWTSRPPSSTNELPAA
jgi:hypothetical protein